MTSPDIPFRLRHKRLGLYFLVVVLLIVACLPAVMLIVGPGADDGPEEFTDSVKAALIAGSAVALLLVGWFSYRILRQSVVVHAERLVVRNLGRTYSIPFGELREVRGVRITPPLGRGAASIPRTDVVALHGERSIRIAAAAAATYQADDYQAPLWAALEDLAKLYRFQVVRP